MQDQAVDFLLEQLYCFKGCSQEEHDEMLTLNNALLPEESTSMSQIVDEWTDSEFGRHYTLKANIASKSLLLD